MTTIAVVGAGYVGLACGTVFAREHAVTLLDIDDDRVAKINAMVDDVGSDVIHLKATTHPWAAYQGADVVVIATPTNYCDDKGGFDTSSIDGVLADIHERAMSVLVVIKSTVPVGYTRACQLRYPDTHFVCMPEFLREDHAMEDCIKPSRIVIGGTPEANHEAVTRQLVTQDAPVVLCSSDEAEAIKLFSNAHLAMRVAFFNELDTFASAKGLSTDTLIHGVGLDERIGNHYNNPSFGYGGYCLPKDTRQLQSQYGNIPQTLIRAVIQSNHTRLSFVANEIMARSPKRIGIYRLTMKPGSDNFRDSSVIELIKRLANRGATQLIIYEPLVDEPTFMGIPVFANLKHFTEAADLIVTNYMDEELQGVKDKVYTRACFNVF